MAVLKKQIGAAVLLRLQGLAVCSISTLSGWELVPIAGGGCQKSGISSTPGYRSGFRPLKERRFLPCRYNPCGRAKEVVCEEFDRHKHARIGSGQSTFHDAASETLRGNRSRTRSRRRDTGITRPPGRRRLDKRGTQKCPLRHWNPAARGHRFIKRWIDGLAVATLHTPNVVEWRAT